MCWHCSLDWFSSDMGEEWPKEADMSRIWGSELKEDEERGSVELHHWSWCDREVRLNVWKPCAMHLQDSLKRDHGWDPNCPLTARKTNIAKRKVKQWEADPAERIDRLHFFAFRVQAESMFRRHEPFSVARSLPLPEPSWLCLRTFIRIVLIPLQVWPWRARRDSAFELVFYRSVLILPSRGWDWSYLLLRTRQIRECLLQQYWVVAKMQQLQPQVR